MVRALMFFAAGWYLGRNRGAVGQVVAAGQQLLDAQTGTPVATNVLPDTTIVSPRRAAVCPPGYFYYAGGLMGSSCVSKAEYDALMSGQLVQGARLP